jgi:hypothetical protein
MFFHKFQPKHHLNVAWIKGPDDKKPLKTDNGQFAGVWIVLIGEKNGNI